MANVRGGISGIYGCIQYDTGGTVSFPNHMSTVNAGVNNGNATEYVSNTMARYGVGVNNFVTTIRGKRRVKSLEYIRCGGRDTGLWGVTESRDDSLWVEESGVRSVYCGYMITGMWRASHRAGGDVNSKVRFVVYNKAGVAIYDTGIVAANARPENGLWTGPYLYQIDINTNEDIGRVQMIISTWTSDNNWHDIGDRGTPNTSWVPSFGMGNKMWIHFSAKYPYWVVPWGGAANSQRYVHELVVNHYIG
ncbi:MAG: hypothetical protein ACRC92_23905 [Peptostreptococcaceae bacterium]